MVAANRSGVDRRSQSQTDINALVLARSETLSLYAGLATHRPFLANDKFHQELKCFCDALIDYTAGAHFQLYQHLAENKERRIQVMNVANQVYAKISDTTDQILEFNDRYSDEQDLISKVENVERDLSNIGEILADRIQYEDQVIDAMRSERRTS